ASLCPLQPPLHHLSLLSFFLMIRHPPTSPPFPYTTLFRSTARRLVTDTPLQSLVFLDDPVYVECAQALAARVLREHANDDADQRSEEHTSELQSLTNLVCRLLLEKKNSHTPAQH